ncbi:DUF3105 domain-containing protein [Euzebya sp.]|uniref:DUF3105 domain-containing protein n=1 Tax=Euzebya sp. TaxID=1971409 RepID=UPI0035176C34
MRLPHDGQRRRPVLLAVLLAVLLGACGSSGATSAPNATARCDAPELPPVQFGSHLIGDAEPPVPYSSVPPSSGWHASGALDITAYPPSNPLSEPQQVSVLEAGAVVVTYRGLTDDDVATLVEHVQTAHPGQAATTPYDRLDDGQVALAGWGVVQRCHGVDLDSIDAFVAAYAVEDPFVPGTDRTPRPRVSPGAD